MSAVPENRGSRATAWLEWLPVAAGLLVLYVPTFYGLASSIWQQEEHAHGPIIAAIIVWLIYQRRAAFLAAPAHRAPVPGFLLLVFGLLLYVLGRSQAVALFEIGALAPILAGALLTMRGWPVLRSLWFPLFFIVFLLPLPGIFVDALTGPLKQYLSEITVQILYMAGYPIARSGVVINIGQYQLLVADACSGLHSMFSLLALGLLFMYLMARTRPLHNAIMLGSILPIAFLANIVRVLVLILVTYHFGDESGQGFLHGAAGIVLLMAALGLLVLVDAALVRVIRPHRRERTA